MLRFAFLAAFGETTLYLLRIYPRQFIQPKEREPDDCATTAADEYHNRFRSTLHQHDPDSLARRSSEGEFWSSRTSARSGADGVCTVGAIPPSQSAESKVVQSRSIPVVGGAWVDVGLFASASDRVRFVTRRFEKFSTMGIEDTRTSREHFDPWG